MANPSKQYKYHTSNTFVCIRSYLATSPQAQTPSLSPEKHLQYNARRRNTLQSETSMLAMKEQIITVEPETISFIWIDKHAIGRVKHGIDNQMEEFLLQSPHVQSLHIISRSQVGSTTLTSALGNLLSTSYVRYLQGFLQVVLFPSKFHQCVLSETVADDILPQMARTDVDWPLQDVLVSLQGQRTDKRTGQRPHSNWCLCWKFYTMTATVETAWSYLYLSSNSSTAWSRACNTSSFIYPKHRYNLLLLITDCWVRASWYSCVICMTAWTCSMRTLA